MAKKLISYDDEKPGLGLPDVVEARIAATHVDMEVSASQSTATLGPELVTEDGWTLGAGWSGDLASGFTHAAGDSSVLEYSSEDFGSGLFLVKFTLSSTIPPLQNLDVSLGDSDVPYIYASRTDDGIALLATAAGPLKFTPVRSTPWSGTITEISVREVVGDVPPSMVWQDDQGQDVVNVRVGQAGQGNFFLGDQAGQKNVSGYGNVVLGRSSMGENASGYWNVAVGFSAMRNNVSGSRNIAVGQRALVNNTTGYRNVVVGQSAMVNNTTGQGNIAIGADSMLYNETGTRNIAIGMTSLGVNKTGDRNIAIGNAAMNNAKADSNTAIGDYALYASESEGNVAVGAQAARYTKAGGVTAVGYSAGINVVSGVDNTTLGYEAGRGRYFGAADFSRVTAIGKNAARRLGTGHDDNVAIGYNAFSNTDGGVENTVVGANAGRSATGNVLNHNVLIGRNAGFRLETGADENTILGTQAGNLLTTGAKNVLIGYNVQASSPTAANEINIGNVFRGSNATGALLARLMGDVEMPDLPTTLPTTPGRVWNDAGTLKVS